MTTRVIHIKDSNPDDPNQVFIGRQGKGGRFVQGGDGRFGNPVVIGAVCPVCGKTHRDAGSTLPCYRRWLNRELDSNPAFRAEVAALHGKTLVCFCAPGPCHGDVLARAAAWLQAQADAVPAEPVEAPEEPSGALAEPVELQGESAAPSAPPCSGGEPPGGAASFAGPHPALHDPVRVVCRCAYSTLSHNLPAMLPGRICPVCKRDDQWRLLAGDGSPLDPAPFYARVATAATPDPPAAGTAAANDRFLPTAELDPREDGVTHINVYSKGATELGRQLSHYSSLGFTLKGQRYASVESFWFVVKMYNANAEAGAEIFSRAEMGRVASLPGYRAKEYYRGLERTPEGAPPTRDQLRAAYVARFEAHPKLKEDLMASTLPLAHYYVYGGLARDAAPWGWTAELSAEMRAEYRAERMSPPHPPE